MKLRIIAVALAGLVATACTTTSEMQLAPDRAVMTTRGNAFASPERVEHDLLLEAAKLTQKNGYEWFLVETSRDVSTRHVFVQPAQGSGSFSGNAYGFSGSSSYRGATYIPYMKPGMSVAIRFGRGARPEQAIDAAFILAQNPK